MIIELKDIPAQPIRKLDIHIEFSDSGITVTSQTFPNPLSNGSKDFPNSPVKQDNLENSKEPSEIPQEMLNADF